jgi:hypothetical protein
MGIERHSRCATGGEPQQRRYRSSDAPITIDRPDAAILDTYLPRARVVWRAASTLRRDFLLLLFPRELLVSTFLLKNI